MQTSESQSTRTASKPRLVGINHIALEVGNLEEAVAFYGRLFSLTLQGRHQGKAFIDLGISLLHWSNNARTPAPPAPMWVSGQ
jgi:catechol 2,3-dioxygenase-like lactoylglutathione lyase family enzyme